MNVVIFGLGYVGCVSAACLSKLGHTVIGVDKDTNKVALIQRGIAPFYEPNLEELLQQGVQAGTIQALDQVGDHLQTADVVLICVGTPSDDKGNLALHFLEGVCQEIYQAPRPQKLIVCIRSTIFPGISEQLHRTIFQASKEIVMVSNPEFLREGSAVKDFWEPSLIVVGGSDPEAVDRVAALYKDLPCPTDKVDTRSAETVKYACNAFHALKISFANEIASLCDPLGVDGSVVMRLLCQDKKLNVSSAYLRPGFAFGGSCLPKDLRALQFQASALRVDLPLLGNVLRSNEAHLNRLAGKVLALPHQRIGLFGLAFKENTDDLRESPGLLLAQKLLKAGQGLRIHDAHIDLQKIHGANQRYLLEKLPEILELMDPDFESWLGWSEVVVLTQSPAKSWLDRLEQSGKPILNLAA